MRAVTEVVLVDDHALVRAGIRALLESVQGVVVTAESDNGRGVLEAMQEHEPDVLMVDLSMPEMNGLEVIHRVSKRHPTVRILVLSMHREPEYVTRALREGATGYLVKGAFEEELAVAVRAVARGDTYLSPAIAGPALSAPGGPKSDSDPFEALTDRQREVLQLIAEGHSTSEIAKKLYLSVKTVESHRSAVMSRLGIRDVAGLVRFAIRSGLVTAET